MTRIKHKESGRVLYEFDGSPTRAVETAITQGIPFSWADLSGLDLRYAILDRGNFRWADFRGTNLGRADFLRADLYGANFAGAKLCWSSHELLAEILRQAAGDSVPRLKVAGLIMVCRSWCWSDFAKHRDDPEFGWALSSLAGFVQPDENPAGIPAMVLAKTRIFARESGVAF